MNQWSKEKILGGRIPIGELPGFHVVSIWFSLVAIDGNNIGREGVTLDQIRNHMQILMSHAKPNDSTEDAARLGSLCVKSQERDTSRIPHFSQNLAESGPLSQNAISEHSCSLQRSSPHSLIHNDQSYISKRRF